LKSSEIHRNQVVGATTNTLNISTYPELIWKPAEQHKDDYCKLRRYISGLSFAALLRMHLPKF
jgi:hypothetical protein